ncbi:XRE family transcriptional regulator [Salmonella enterica subsp. enterica serovar Birkenhead]|uniref:helix-turn-helix domain-containing protein n=1 Tax=Salmonella enterica TaxID=28901 RepID=UPI0012A818F6|nr:XRE family transcriptional regulator [Salmonella enterica subsp. enterica serovar Birkenhead]EHI3951176.1 helix-turn-helix transcriptional regulator [Salmonella enterica]EDV0048649.1 helix-turn-helix transcriptional regulator [Salmonella enterica subsp. enterica serovar Birkenhead]EHI6135404.1 helix-turn-helix transcriptional regulator [Salmonella enterica]EHI7993680.1 helix-turn-helix transcriptional regulator [Salmonella enterica]
MIGKRLKAARKAALMTQTELAKRAGIDELTVSRISHYETDTHSPNFQQACRFADVLDIPEYYLYCRDDVLATQLLALHKRYKKFRFNPAEISELEKAEKELKTALETIASLLNKRTDIMINDELPTSLKP